MARTQMIQVLNKIRRHIVENYDPKKDESDKWGQTSKTANYDQALIQTPKPLIAEIQWPCLDVLM